jgi:penicillin G amidase
MRQQTIHVPGLNHAAEIVVDRWGIPHIRAQNLLDMFFVQGFNAARDRLWQMDLWRKRGLGLLARDFGAGYLAQDTASRLFLYRGDMDAEWAVYCEDAKAICEAFSRGINAWIDFVAANPSWMPPEFTLMGTQPDKWSAEDVVRVRVHSWMRNAASEVIRANVMAASSTEADLLRQNLDPFITPKVPEGLDPASIPMEVLDIFKLALAPVTFSDGRLSASLAEAAEWIKITPLGEVVREMNGQGSNNWAIHGSRTETGRPILANDPHRAHAVPPIRYLVHLSCPEFDAIGAGEPVNPGIMLGHNGNSAFGLTLFFGPDEEDVYVYETAPDQPNRYRYRDGWEDMRLVEEVVPLKGADGKPVVLKFTRHGPIIYEDVKSRRAYALRSVWFEPGASPYMVSLSSMRRNTFKDFRRDMERWAVPAVNMVYADTSGDIGWVVAGYSPVRRNWDGLLPVPGDGRFEWEGFLTGKELPYVLNPDAGYFSTSNEMNLPPDWDHDKMPVGYEWYDRARASRLAEVFAATEKHTVAISCAMQTDIVSMPARRATALLAGVSSDHPEASRALAMLQGFDGAIWADSAAAALFEVWWSQYLRPGLFALATPDTKVRGLLGPGDADGVLRQLENPGPMFGDAPVRGRDELLTSTLASAWIECVRLMGADSDSWQWGSLHHAYFSHPLSALCDKPVDVAMDVGPLPVAGSDSTPMNTMYRFNDYRVVLGASVRVVIDVGEWDQSRCINAPGQAGDPRSPHYADLAPGWSRGEYVPLLYSRQAVEEAAEETFRLLP